MKRLQKFAYPDAFKLFLKAENCKIQEEILDKLNAPAVVPFNENETKINQQHQDQRAKQKTNNLGVSRTFYVFQGSTFEKEYSRWLYLGTDYK